MLEAVVIGMRAEVHVAKAHGIIASRWWFHQTLRYPRRTHRICPTSFRTRNPSGNLDYIFHNLHLVTKPAPQVNTTAEQVAGWVAFPWQDRVSFEKPTNKCQRRKARSPQMTVSWSC
jgi:hypothetical protein